MSNNNGSEGNERLANAISLLNIKSVELKYAADNYDALLEESFVYKEKDVGLRNLSTRSRLKINENGNVELLAGDASGMLINNRFKTVNLYGTAINANASLVRLNTRPNGLMWNDSWQNPRLYQISDKLNPKLWTGSWGQPLSGKAYTDDLVMKCNARWWCPGTPNLCGQVDPPGEHHAGHWVRYDLDLTPFFRAWDDIEYRKQLDDLGIPN